MKRGEVYWHIYRDKTGQERRIPFLVVSNDEYNNRGDFVNGVRMVHFDNDPQPYHVPIPEDAFEVNTVIKSSVALCETMSSVRKGNLQGPVAFLPNGYHMAQVCEGIGRLCGMASEKKHDNAPDAMAFIKPVSDGIANAVYSASLNAPENKQTKPDKAEDAE